MQSELFRVHHTGLVALVTMVPTPVLTFGWMAAVFILFAWPVNVQWTIDLERLLQTNLCGCGVCVMCGG